MAMAACRVHATIMVRFSSRCQMCGNPVQPSSIVHLRGDETCIRGHMELWVATRPGHDT